MSVADRIALGLPLIERIKEVIGERKIKQARLARECGIEKSLVSKTLRGVVRLRQPDALSMVLALNRAVEFSRRGGGYAFKSPKTARSRRTISLSPILVDKLSTLRDEQEAELIRIKATLKATVKPSREYRKEHTKQILKNAKLNQLVFPSQDFTPIKNYNLSRRYFKAILKDAKLSSKFRPYSLRHSCATLLLAANVHPKIVSERLGHSSIALTLDTYSHVAPGMQEVATQSLANALYE